MGWAKFKVRARIMVSTWYTFAMADLNPYQNVGPLYLRGPDWLNILNTAKSSTVLISAHFNKLTHPAHPACSQSNRKLVLPSRVHCSYEAVACISASTTVNKDVGERFPFHPLPPFPFLPSPPAPAANP